ncbi:MAG: PAS domain S-box protein [bacterium]
MIQDFEHILLAAQSSTQATGLRVGDRSFGRCDGTEVVSPSATWFFGTNPASDMAPWEPLLELALRAERLEKRNEHLERDVKTLDRVENELRKSRAMAWTLFDATPTPIFVEDLDGAFLFVNRHAETMLGRDREDLLARSTDEALPWLRQAEGRATVCETQLELAYEAEHDQKGTVFFVTKFPLIGQDGEVSSVGTILFDITRRRASERALADSERSYREIFEKASDLIIIHTVEDGRILAVNGGVETLGYNALDLVGKRLDVLSAAAEVPNVTSLERALSGINMVTWPVAALDGTTRWYQFRTSRTQILGEERYLTIARDVTREKLEQERRVTVEENLHRAQKYDALGRLASNIAHEFSNLLSVILSYSDLLARQLSEPRNLEDLATIQDAATRASTLVRQLMTLGQRRYGTPVPTNVSQQVEHLRELLDRSLGSNVRFELNVAKTPLVRIDPAQLDRVLVNLTLHSRLASPIDSRFRLNVRPANPDEAAAVAATEAVVVEMSDFGRGHTEAEVNTLFEPFWSGADGESKIGLANAYATVAHLGGSITATATEKETHFKIVLPATDDTVDEPRTVLLTDDDPTVLATLRKSLEYRGWRVLSARSGEEALSLAERFDGGIDIVISDVVMPKMSGAELASRLRELYPNVSILMMSGYSPENLQTGLDADVVVKPFSTTQLLEAIERNLKEKT